MADKPMLVLVSTYGNVDDAEADYKSVMSLHKEGDLGHLAAAIVTKDADGKVKVRRHDTTAKHLAWGGAIIGALLGILLPPLGIMVISGSVLAGMTAGAVVDGAVLAGVGGVMGHYWRGIPRKDVQEMSEALENSHSGLVVVAVDKKEAEIEKAIMKADKTIAKRIEQGDVEAAYNDAVKEATERQMAGV